MLAVWFQVKRLIYKKKQSSWGKWENGDKNGNGSSFFAFYIIHLGKNREGMHGEKNPKKSMNKSKPNAQFIKFLISFLPCYILCKIILTRKLN